MGLFDGRAEGDSIIGLAMDDFGFDNPIILPGGHKHHFAAKLVAFVNLALGSAFQAVAQSPAGH